MTAKKRLLSWSGSLLAVILTCLFPCVFIYAQNAGEARAADMLFFIKIFLLTAAAGMAAASVLFRNVSRAGLVTCVGMLVVINFSLVSDALPLPGEAVLAITCLLLLALCILLFIKKPDLTVLCWLIAIAFAALCLINLGLSAITLMSSGHSVTNIDNQEIPSFSAESAKPNVYFLLFDEYGGSANLTRYYDYDNEEFLTALEDLGFTVSRSTCNTESCWTDTLVPNLMNLSYVADDSVTTLERRALLDNPYLYRMFSENGYEINLINHRAYLSSEGVNELTEDQAEDTISSYLLERSIFNKVPAIRSRITKQFWRNYRDQYEEPIRNCFEQLSTCCEQAGSGPTLTVSYIQCPHTPYLFDAEGGIVPAIARWNCRDHSYFLNQLTYLNEGILLPAIRNIREQDPSAVILLLSDHGSRLPVQMVSQYGGPRFDAEEETGYMQNALCCVYIPDGTLDIEGDTGINTIRKTINAVFGTALPLLDAPEGYVVDESWNAAN